MRSVSRVLFALALVVALTVITGPSASAASALGAGTQSRAGSSRAADDIVLTYTKWFAPSYPNMQGVVGGDITGRFGGAVLSRTDLPTVVLLQARYEIIANTPSRSFTALIAGSLDKATGVAMLNGTVTSGWLAGEPVHVEFRVISCTQAADHTCFTGTIRVIGDSETGNQN